MKKEIGVYIHIPFCVAKCYYCDFVSFANKNNLLSSYVNSIVNEIKNANLSKYDIDTIYIGGGTPSILDSESILKILREISKYSRKAAEITMEVNPGTVNEEKLRKYKEIGVNRLSIGAQSTENILLKQIGRIHTYEEFLQVYKSARKIGFNNINIDLMLGLPNQSLNILEKSIKEIIHLNPEHISIYSLILEKNTKLYEMVNKGELILPSEELEREMYWKVKKSLQEKGYIHYEISNFAKKGYESKHNCNCWEQKEYLGFGVAAHSYIENRRFSNIENIEKYINNIKRNNFEKNIIIHENQKQEDKKKEYMLLGLRKIEGININKYMYKFGDSPTDTFKMELNKLIKEKLLEIDGENIRLTAKGLDLANLVWQEFV